MDNLIENIKNEFKNVPDFKIKKIRVTLTKIVYVLFIETICDSDKVTNYILRSLHNYNKFDLNSNTLGGNTVVIDNKDQIEFYLTNGFAVVINNETMLAIEVKGNLSRSVTEALREPSLLGPEDSFVENYQVNVGLIKRRIKSNTLKTKELVMGRKSKTQIGILYLEDVVDNKRVKEIYDKLSKIDIDGVLDCGTLINYIESENKSVFPTIRRTERPDFTCNSLLEGKIIIMMDTSPFALILPSFLADFINPVSDNYVKSINVTFLKILRICAFLISMLAPAFFISIVNYNQETIPSTLLISFCKQKAGVPFPGIVELLILLFICDLLRESDLRFPSNFGSTISILGALIIGDAAVNASIVSPITIIVAALTLISSLIFNELEINNALRYYRYLILFMAAFLGLYGLFLGTTLFFINVISLSSLDAPYFAPIAPFNKDYFFKTILKKKDKNNTKRSTLLTHKNMIRGNIK